MVDTSNKSEAIEKKKILFVYYTMMLGGSTTSLLSLLNEIDHEKYDVDLLLYRNEGPYISYVPDKVNLLPQACVINNRFKQVAKSMLNGSLVKGYIRSFKYTKKFKLNRQTASYTQLSFSRRLEKKYDVAIGFMELWSDVYVNNCVNADKKISWVHVDYEKAHFIPEIDRKMFAKSRRIVHVSEECRNNFEKSFPELKDRCCCIENILTKQFIQKREASAKDIPINVDASCLNLLSVCRLAIDHKGLDRGISAIKRIKDEGFSVKWYIAGDGPDKEKVISLIHSNGLDNDIFLLGALECPYSIFKYFDAFFLPSRFEGKPMAITESLMLGLPPIVSKYASANEQIVNGYDGLIAENNEDDIFDCLLSVCRDKSILQKLRNNILATNYDNVDQIQRIYSLIDAPDEKIGEL